jgi:two-component system, chemotaxis family, CheB/CheR fusion protein
LGWISNDYTEKSNSHPEGLFRTVDRNARIYQSMGRRAGEMLPFPRLLPAVQLPDPAASLITGERLRIADSQNQHRQALIELGPASVLVDDTYRILHPF